MHTLFTKNLIDVKTPTQKIHKLMDILSQMSIRYLICIILNRSKLEKKQSPNPLE